MSRQLAADARLVFTDQPSRAVWGRRLPSSPETALKASFSGRRRLIAFMAATAQRVME